jgi:hypothetical protein
MDIQVLIPPALAALHNFIRKYDPDDISAYDEDLPDFEMDRNPEDAGELGRGPATSNERERANRRRDQIASDMWDQYQRYLAAR